MSFSAALKLAVEALSGETPLTPELLEVGVLDRHVEGRCYRRLDNDEIAELLA